MRQGLSQRAGLRRRPRSFLIGVAWLCFMVAATPCIAAAGSACCPAGSGTPAASAPDHHHGHATLRDGMEGVHDHGAMPAGEPRDQRDDHRGPHPSQPAGAPEHDCFAVTAECCDDDPPTLEDRSPKPLSKPTDGGQGDALFPEAAVGELARHQRPPATGPPDPARPGPSRHLELCRFLI
jgi:hypothetical protein